jgi:S-adenosylmethionine hydrolase
MIITLTTDFGLRDAYVGIVKGVMFSIAPEVRLVDISHDIRPHDVAEGAFALVSGARYFPPGTVHLAVVDPGVGSERRAIAASDGRHMFVGPDNGLLSLCLDESAVVHQITNEAYFLSPVSPTFHARDIFAPVAARLASGMPLQAVGPEIHDLLKIKSHEQPQVLHIDRFGNIVTSLRPEDLSPDSALKIGETRIGSFQKTYASGRPGQLFLLVGSSGYLEVAMNQESAASRLNAVRGANVEIVQ